MRKATTYVLLTASITTIALTACSQSADAPPAQHSLDGTADELSSPDDQVSRLASLDGSCAELGLEKPMGYFTLLKDEFVDSLTLKTQLDEQTTPEAFYRIHIVVSTELEQVHQKFDIPVDGAEQLISIELEKLRLNTYVEKIGILGLTVELFSNGGKERLLDGHSGRAVGNHLRFHVDDRGLGLAYLPQLADEKYARQWAEGVAARPQLHASNKFRTVKEDGDGESEHQDLPKVGVPSSTIKFVDPPDPNVRYCPNMSTEFVDAGFGEDYFTSSALTARPMYGSYLEIFDGNTIIATGYLDYDDGCIETYLAPDHDYVFKLWASSKIASNYYKVQTSGGQTRTKSYTIRPTSNSLQTWAPNFTDSDAQERWNIYGALIRSGRKHGVGSNTYLFRYDASYDARWTGVEGQIGTTQAGHKFIISHEYGHGLQDKVNGSTFAGDYEVGEDDNNNGTCDVSPVPDDDCRSHTGTGSVDCVEGGGHKLWSLEHEGSAASEGWAHFVSADVWNDHDTDDCSFTYWREKGQSGYRQDAVNCEGSQTDYPTRFMEVECNTNSASWSGKGVEVDWLRAFWDVHTGVDGHISMATMLEWIDVSGLTVANTYSKLNTSADSMGDPLNGQWDSAKTGNGVDH